MRWSRKSPADGAGTARASRSSSLTVPEPTVPEPTVRASQIVSGPLSDPEFVAGLRPVPSGLGDSAPSWPAVDVVGVRPDGSPVTVELAGRNRPVLLVFLTIDCDGCDLFWIGLADGPAEVDIVAVTKSPAEVSPYEVAARTTGPVVMSDAAWIDYRVTGYPFLVLVDPGPRRIVAESVGFAWSDVDAMVTAFKAIESGDA